MPLESSSTEAASSSTSSSIIPEDIIDWRAVASQLGSLVKIKLHESVVKQSGCVVINSRHSIPVQSFSGAETRATLFYIPGTGSVANCTDAIDAYASQMSAILSCRVVVIHPRFVPENKHPVPYNDVISVIKYLIEHGHENFVDEKGVRYDFKSRALVISGYSSGGLLATQIYLNSFQEGVSPFCQLLAIAPIVDISTLSNLSYGEKQQHFQEIFERFPSLYLPEGQPLASGHHSPRHMNLSELQLSSGRMTFIVGEKDPLKPQITDFVQWLQSLGCRAENRVIDDADHGLTWLQLSHLEDVKASFQSMLPEGPGPEHFELARLTRWLTLNEINESIISSLQAQLPHKLSGERFDLASDFMKLSFKTLEQEQDMKNKDKHEGGKSLTDEQLFNDEHRYLLAGESGSGKTTWLYHYVIQQLSASRFRSCILIRCRDFAMFNRRDADRGLDIQQLLQGLFFGRLTDSKGAFHEASRLEEYRKYILSHPELVLLAIDGADELPATLAAEHQLHQLLAYFPNVIMTGRHHALAAYARDKHYLQLQLQALTGEQQRSRLSRELPGTGSQPVFPLHSPLLLDLYCFSQQENAGRSISNQYQLLQQAVQQMIARYQSQRMGAASSSIHSSMSWQRSKPWQLALAMAARQGLQLMFSLDEVDTIVGELSHNNNRFFSIRDADYFWSDSGIANCGLFKTSQTGLEFIHPSFQAFFLAHHWLDLLENDPDQVMVLLIKHKYDDNYLHFWMILTGLLSQHPEQLCLFHSMWQKLKNNIKSFKGTGGEYALNCYFYESLCNSELPQEIEQGKIDFLQESISYWPTNHGEKLALRECYRECHHVFNSMYVMLKNRSGIVSAVNSLSYRIGEYFDLAVTPMLRQDLLHTFDEWRKEKERGELKESRVNAGKAMIALTYLRIDAVSDKSFAEHYIQFVLEHASKNVSVEKKLKHYQFNLEQIECCIKFIEAGIQNHAACMLHAGDMSLADEKQVLRLIEVAVSSSYSDDCRQSALLALVNMPEAFMLKHGDRLISCLNDENMTTCYYAAYCLSRINHEVIQGEVIHHFPRLFFGDKTEKGRSLLFSGFDEGYPHKGGVVQILGNKLMTTEFADQLASILLQGHSDSRYDLLERLIYLTDDLSFPHNLLEAVWFVFEDLSKQTYVLEARKDPEQLARLQHTLPSNVIEAICSDLSTQLRVSLNMSCILNIFFIQQLKRIPEVHYQKLFELLINGQCLSNKEYIFLILNKLEDKKCLRRLINLLPDYLYIIKIFFKEPYENYMVDLVEAGFKQGLVENDIAGLMAKIFKLCQHNNLHENKNNILKLKRLFIKYQKTEWLEHLDQICYEKLLLANQPDFAKSLALFNTLPADKIKAIRIAHVKMFNALFLRIDGDNHDILTQLEFLTFIMPAKKLFELLQNSFDNIDSPVLKEAFVDRIRAVFKIVVYQNKIYFQHHETKQQAEFTLDPLANNIFSALKERQGAIVQPVSSQSLAFAAVK